MAKKIVDTSEVKQDNTGTELSADQVREVVKKRKRSPAQDWMKELKDTSGEPGDNSRFIRHAMASWGLPPIDISDPKQVQDRIGLYFQYCVENDRKPQVVGMCNWLGISRQALNEWQNGVTRSATHGDIVKKAMTIIEEVWADFMMNGKINPVTGIFLAKNWYGYKDTADVVVTPNNPYQAASEAELKNKYIEDLPPEE